MSAVCVERAMAGWALVLAQSRDCADGVVSYAPPRTAHVSVMPLLAEQEFSHSATLPLRS